MDTYSDDTMDCVKLVISMLIAIYFSKATLKIIVHSMAISVLKWQQ